MNKKTLVLGASPNPDRYSYKSVRKLLANGHDVVPLGIRDGTIENLEIQKGQPVLENIHTVTVYLNPCNQEQYYDYILSLKPSRIIFNPGTENYSFAERCKQNGVEVVELCTLIMINADMY